MWSRPPKCLPIAGSDSPVSSRARYMATWRGQAMRGVRAVDRSSSGERPKCSHAAAWISAIDALAAPAGGAGVEAVEHLGRELGGERPAGERAEGDDADQRALERAHVVLDALGDHLQGELVGQLDAVVVGALAQDRQARGELGWLDVGDEAGLEALAQAVLERLQVVRGAVGGEHDLAPAVVQGVEGVEELLLGLGLALEELDVVEQQHVDVAEARLEVLGVAVAERVEELVREGLAGRAAHGEPGLWASSRLAIELSRWVLPTPGGPQMKSGL